MKIAYRDGNIIVLNTNNSQYRYSRNELLAAEMQNELGVVIARAFDHWKDRLAGRLTMKIYKDAVREALDEESSM